MQQSGKKKASWATISIAYNKASAQHKLHLWLRYISLPFGCFFEKEFHGARILDYGCGHGILLALLAHNNADNDFYGIEHDERKNEVIAQCLPQVKMINGKDLQEAYSEYFDVAIISDVLYCNTQQVQQQVLDDIFKCLKPGGKLYLKETVSAPRWKYYFSIFQEMLMVKLLRITKGSVIMLPHPEHYTRLLITSGYMNIESKPVHSGYPYPHYLFSCNK